MTTEERKQKIRSLINNLNDLEEAITIAENYKSAIYMYFYDHDGKKSTHTFNVSNNQLILQFLRDRKKYLNNEIDKLLED